MIREMKEADLQGAGKDEIAEMVREYSNWRQPASDLEAAIDMIDRIRKMPPGARAVIATYLDSGELFCPECGHTSCVHGYPDS